MGMMVMDSGYGSAIPASVIVNLSKTGSASKSGLLNVGDHILSINGINLVGMPRKAYIDQIKVQWPLYTYNRFTGVVLIEEVHIVRRLCIPRVLIDTPTHTQQNQSGCCCGTGGDSGEPTPFLNIEPPPNSTHSIVMWFDALSIESNNFI